MESLHISFAPGLAEKKQMEKDGMQDLGGSRGRLVSVINISIRWEEEFYLQFGGASVVGERTTELGQSRMHYIQQLIKCKYLNIYAEELDRVLACGISRRLKRLPLE